MSDHISEVVEKAKSGGIDYDWTAFLEKTPPNSSKPAGELIKWYRCRSKAEHSALIEAVRKRGNYLWYAHVVKTDSGYLAVEPHLIDWDSVPEKATQQKAKDKGWDGGLSCPFCAKKVSSTPGRTLHVKHDHQDRLAEYQELVAKKTVVKKANMPSAKSRGEGELSCPFCDKVVHSIPGRTLHVKHFHPGRLNDYKAMNL